LFPPTLGRRGHGQWDDRKDREGGTPRSGVIDESFRATFDGDNNPHTVEFGSQGWKCDCDFFQRRGVCSHTMALERVLERMLPVSVEVT
jgi:hypothetical protein